MQAGVETNATNGTCKFPIKLNSLKPHFALVNQKRIFLLDDAALVVIKYIFYRINIWIPWISDLVRPYQLYHIWYQLMLMWVIFWTKLYHITISYQLQFKYFMKNCTRNNVFSRKKKCRTSFNMYRTTTSSHTLINTFSLKDTQIFN